MNQTNSRIIDIEDIKTLLYLIFVVDLQHVATTKQVALYYSDVSGADKVCNVRLLKQIVCSGLHPIFVQFLTT